ncbi:MAG: TonB-dependent receptor, partial [Flavobacterium sp.]|nr:TonB-dependent receptor [Flavobacterium sp.]
HFHPHPIDWLHINSSYERVTGKSKNGDYLPLIPANRFNNTLRIDIKSLKWFKNGFASATAEHTLKQNNPSEFETNTNDYTLVNFGLGGQIIVGKTNFSLSLNANNVFNRVYVAHLSRLKADGIPNIGRNIVLAINVKM